MSSRRTISRQWRDFLIARSGTAAVEFGFVGLAFIASILFVFQIGEDVIMSRALEESARVAGRIVILEKPANQLELRAKFVVTPTRFLDRSRVLFNVTDITRTLPDMNVPPMINGRRVGQKPVGAVVPQDYPAALSAGTIVLVEAFYPVPWFLPLRLTGVETLPSGQVVRWRGAIAVGAVE